MLIRRKEYDTPVFPKLWTKDQNAEIRAAGISEQESGLNFWVHSGRLTTRQGQYVSNFKSDP